MAEALPINFQIPSPATIASYNYEEISDGIYGITYYLYLEYEEVAASPVMSYWLGKDTPYSYIQGYELSSPGNTSTKTFYSSTFNAPRTAEGVSTVNLCINLTSNNQAVHQKIEIKLYHYDGSSSTQLGSTWSSNWVTAINATTTQAILAKIAIPKTKFKIGDSIKMEIKDTAEGYAGSWVSGYLGTDPQNRDYGTLAPSTVPDAFTNSTLKFPFRTP